MGGQPSYQNEAHIYAKPPARPRPLTTKEATLHALSQGLFLAGRR
jgi:hypothetical protein